MHEINIQNKRQIDVRIVLIISCYLLSITSSVINLDSLVFSCAVLFGIITIRKNPGFIIKYAYFLLSSVLAIFGTFLIESNRFYLVELQRYSEYVGALPLISGYYLLFIYLLESFDNKNNKNNEKNACIRRVNYSYGGKKILQILLKIFSIVFFAITAIMFLRVLSKPYFLLHIDRFEYREIYITGIWAKLDDYYYYFIPLVLMNWHNGKNRKISLATGILYVLYLLLQGEKYGKFAILLLFITMYEIPKISNFKSIRKKRERKKYRKFIIVLVILLCLLLGIIINQYNFLYQSLNSFAHLFERLAQQGQLWWSIYGLQIGNSPRITEIGDELAAYTDRGVQNPYYGIYKVMYLSAPYDLVTRKIASGSTYTESTAASLYYYFGFISLPIFALVMSAAIAFLAKKYLDYIRMNCVIEVMIVARTIFLGKNVLFSSNFSWWLDSKTLITVLIWIACAIYRKNCSSILHSRLNYNEECF